MTALIILVGLVAIAATLVKLFQPSGPIARSLGLMGFAIITGLMSGFAYGFRPWVMLVVGIVLTAGILALDYCDRHPSSTSLKNLG